MPTELLSSSVVTAITQNTVYALPFKACIIQSDAAVELAGTITGPWTAYTPGSFTAASFVRCPSANTNISVKV